MAIRAVAVARLTGALEGTAAATRITEDVTNALACFVRTPMGFVPQVSSL